MFERKTLLRALLLSFGFSFLILFNTNCTKGTIQNSFMSLELGGVVIKEPNLGRLSSRYLPEGLNIKGTCNSNLSGFQVSNNGSNFSDLNESSFGISADKTSCESNNSFSLSINELKNFLESLQIPTPLDGRIAAGSEISFYLKVFDVRSTSPAFKITIVGTTASVEIASGLGPNPTNPSNISHLDITLSNISDGDQISYFSDSACSVSYNPATQVKIESKVSSAAFDFLNSGVYKIYIKVVDANMRLVQCSHLFTYNYQNPADPSPYGLLAKATAANSLNITWSPGSYASGKTPYYTVEKGTSNSDPFISTSNYCENYTLTNCTISALDSTSDFYYRVKSNVDGQIGYSQVFKFRSIGSFDFNHLLGNVESNGSIKWSWNWPDGGTIATAAYSQDLGATWSSPDTWTDITSSSISLTDPLPRFRYDFKLKISNSTLDSTEIVVQEASGVFTPYKGLLNEQPKFSGFNQGRIVFTNSLSSATASIKGIEISGATDSYKVYLSGETQDSTGGRNGLLKALNSDGTFISDLVFANNTSTSGYDSVQATSSSTNIDTAAAPTTSATKITRIANVGSSGSSINETFNSLIWLGGSSLLVGGGNLTDVTGNLWGFESGKPSSGYWDSSLASDVDLTLGFTNTSLKSSGGFFDMKMAFDRTNKVIYLCPKSQGLSSTAMIAKLEISGTTGQFTKTLSSTLIPGDSLLIQTQDCEVYNNHLYIIAWVSNSTTINKIVVYKYESTLTLDTVFNSGVTPGSVAYSFGAYVPNINSALIVGSNSKSLVMGGGVSASGVSMPLLLSLAISNTPVTSNNKYNGSVGQITGLANDPLDPDNFYAVGYVKGTSPTTDHMSVWSVRWNGSNLDTSNADVRFTSNGSNQVLFNTSTGNTGYEGHDRAYTIKIHPVNHMMYIGGQSEFTAGVYSPIVWLVY